MICCTLNVLQHWRFLVAKLARAKMPTTFIHHALAEVDCTGFEESTFGGTFDFDDQERSTLSIRAAAAPLFPLAAIDGVSVRRNSSEGDVTEESEVIGTFYHECFHAFTLLCAGAAAGTRQSQASHPHFAAIWRPVENAARSYYRGAPLESGETVTDFSDGYDYVGRLVNEAGAEYVGNRAAAYWSALDDLERVRIVDSDAATTDGGANSLPFYDPSRGQKPPADTLHAGRSWKSGRTALHWTESRYKRRIANNPNVFGYVPTSLGKPGGSSFSHTTLPICGELKVYCDTVILENKIPLSFDRLRATASSAVGDR
jgi:hypothetical protein